MIGKEQTSGLLEQQLLKLQILTEVTVDQLDRTELLIMHLDHTTMLRLPITILYGQSINNKM